MIFRSAKCLLPVEKTPLANARGSVDSAPGPSLHTAQAMIFRSAKCLLPVEKTPLANARGSVDSAPGHPSQRTGRDFSFGEVLATRGRSAVR
jgi:hypothetical protein